MNAQRQILVTIAVLTIFGSVGIAFADPSLISILPTNSCLRAGEHLLDPYPKYISCATLDTLSELDTSDQELFGHFEFQTNGGKWIRTPPTIPAAFAIEVAKISDDDAKITWVDPDIETLKHSRVIHLSPYFHTSVSNLSQIFYQGAGDLEYCVAENNFGVCVEYGTRNLTSRGYALEYTYKINVHIDEHCDSAAVGWQNVGLDGLKKVIDYMHNDCQGDLGIKNQTYGYEYSTPLRQCNDACKYELWLADAISAVKSSSTYGELDVTPLQNYWGYDDPANHHLEPYEITNN